MFNTNIIEGVYSKGSTEHTKFDKMHPDTFFDYCEQLKRDKGLTIQYWWGQDVYQVLKYETTEKINQDTEKIKQINKNLTKELKQLDEEN
jgi:hypothetical protein